MEQYYVFEMPGTELPVWCEMFVEGSHDIAPTPFEDIATALAELGKLHPGVTVDSLCDADEIADAQSWAARGGMFNGYAA